MASIPSIAKALTAPRPLEDVPPALELPDGYGFTGLLSDWVSIPSAASRHRRPVRSKPEALENSSVDPHLTTDPSSTRPAWQQEG